MKSARGLSLVELMVAMTLSLLVVAALVALVQTVGRTERAGSALHALQEEGAFAVSAVARELRAMVHPFCRADSGAHTDVAVLDVDGDGTLIDTRSTLHAWLRGWECAPVSACVIDVEHMPIPSVGDGPGARASGTDVLLLRSIAGSAAQNPVRLAEADTGEASAWRLDPADVALNGDVVLADCERSLQLRAHTDDGVLRAESAALPRLPEPGARVFPVDVLATTAFFVGRTDTGTALMRRSAGVTDVLAQGIERFDLRFDVALGASRRALLTAEAVDALGDCGADAGASTCGWDRVVGVEIHVLAAAPAATASDAGWRYAWRRDGTPNTYRQAEDDAHAPPAARREFTTFVALPGLAR